MARVPSPRPVLLLVPVLALLTVAACGGGSGGGEPTQLVLSEAQPPYAVAGSTEPVLLCGQGFSAGGVHVYFDQAEATQVEVLDDAHVRCRPPLLGPGPASIRVETVMGVVTLTRGFHTVLDRLEDYHYVAHQGIAGGDGCAAAHWGTVSLDPVDGLLYGSHSGVECGEVFGPAYRVAVPYAVDANHRIRWEPADGPVWEGGVTADGAVMGLAPVSLGAYPTVALLDRKEGVFSESDLVGTYHLGAIGFRVHWGVSWWGSVSFDGAGRSVLHIARNEEGIVVDERDVDRRGIYEVDADGGITFLWSEEEPILHFRGGLLAGGDLAVLATGNTMGVDPHLEYEMQMVLVRAATPPAAPVLSGSWHVVGMVADEVGGVRRWISSTGTASMVTTDELALEDLVLDDDGVIMAAAVPTTFTTTPGPQGAFTAVMASSGASYVGGLSPDGRFGFLAGGTDPLAPNALHVLFR